MVGSFSNSIESLSVRVGWWLAVLTWLAVFQIWLRSYLQGLGDGWLFIRWGSMLYHSLNGWFMVGSFSNWIESESSRVGWWLAVFQMWFNALLLSQWLGNGWQFFKLIWDHIFKGWMMVGCFSDGVQCYYFMNGWVMVGSFSNWIESVSLRVGWWLAVFHKGVQCFFYFINGWAMVGSFSIYL